MILPGPIVVSYDQLPVVSWRWPMTVGVMDQLSPMLKRAARRAPTVSASL